MAPNNPFAGNVSSPTGLALDIIEVIPANADLTTQLREIRVGTAASGATLRVTGPKGNVVNFPNVQAGERFAGPFVRIHAAGTTASDIVGWV